MAKFITVESNGIKDYLHEVYNTWLYEDYQG